MDDTTTSGDAGATDVAEPTPTTEAVSLGEPGAPTLRPKGAAPSTPPSQTEEPAAPDEPAEQQTAEAQADDLEAWAEKKGLPLDDPRKLAQMYREAEKKIGEATAKARELETTMAQNPNLEYTGNENFDQLAMELNQIKIQNRVRDFFETNPNAREYESKMAEIVQIRPHLQNDS